MSQRNIIFHPCVACGAPTQNDGAVHTPAECFSCRQLAQLDDLCRALRGAVEEAEGLVRLFSGRVAPLPFRFVQAQLRGALSASHRERDAAVDRFGRRHSKHSPEEG